MRDVSFVCGDSSVTVPAELVNRLRLARERGESFWDAWPTAVMLTTHGHRGGVAWRDAFSETRFAWQRAYGGLPASGPERAGGRTPRCDRRPRR